MVPGSVPVLPYSKQKRKSHDKKEEKKKIIKTRITVVHCIGNGKGHRKRERKEKRRRIGGEKILWQ